MTQRKGRGHEAAEEAFTLKDEYGLPMIAAVDIPMQTNITNFCKEFETSFKRAIDVKAGGDGVELRTGSRKPPAPPPASRASKRRRISRDSLVGLLQSLLLISRLG